MYIIKGQDKEFRYTCFNGTAKWQLFSNKGHFICEGTCAEADVEDEADYYFHY